MFLRATNFPRLTALLLVFTLMNCSGGKPADQEANPTSNKLSTNTGSTTSSSDDLLCEKFEEFLNIVTEVYITDIKDQYKSILQQSFQDTSELFSKQLKLDTKKVEKNEIQFQNCAALFDLATQIKNSPNFKKGINSIDLVFDFVANFFISHLDDASHYVSSIFKGTSVQANPERWGLHLLNRTDYFDNKSADGTTVKEARKNVQYLYVESVSQDIQEQIPKKSRIYEINDQKIYEINSQKVDEGPVVGALRLFAKEKIKLLVERWNEDLKKYDEKKEEVTMNAEDAKMIKTSAQEINFEDIDSKYNIGYLKINTFYKEGLESDYFRAWIESQANQIKNDKKKIDGFIIDLRSNRGGFETETEKILNTILPQNAVTFYTAARDDSDGYKITKHKVSGSIKFNFGKIVVLTDFMTASSSEVVVAALQDYGAALIVGETTFGKGIGQSRIPQSSLDNDWLNRSFITNEYIFGPSGRSWYLKGIQPDIEVSDPFNDGYRQRINEMWTKIPAAYPSNIKADTDLSQVKINNRLTSTMLSQLQSYYKNDLKNKPEECTKSIDILAQEASCIKATSIKLLEKWIELETTPPVVQ